MARRKSSWADKSISDIFLWKSFHQSDQNPKGARAKTASWVQTSQVLRVFLDTLSGWERPAILDLGRVRGDNIQFFCDLGFKVHAFDLLQSLPATGPDGGEGSEGSEPHEEDPYGKLAGGLNYPDDSLAGVLCWDVLDYFELKVATSLVQRIKSSMREGGLLLSFFNMRKMNGVPAGRGYRVLDRERWEFVPGGTRPLANHIHQNGEIMKLFAGFKVLYFNFLRSNFREILVQKPIKEE